MQLKNYQQNSLNVLKSYFEKCRIAGHKEAFAQITSDSEIAAHAIKIVSQTWCDKEYPLVLWFVPSDTTRRQTAEALKNPRHPYREALNGQFEGKVRIFDLDEKFNIRPADIADNACIIVSTMQSFVKEDTSKYNVYKDNENLESYFVKMPSKKYGYGNEG
jgi:type III restriction enzyme